MVLVMAVGGSTNAVLHLLAIARTAGVPLELDDFQRVSDRVPLLADLKPSGKYVQEDLHGVGGTPALMKYLLERGLLHGDAMTVTGKTLAENLATAARAEGGADASSSRSRTPINPRGHIRILRGNLAPDRRRGEDHRQGRASASPGRPRCSTPKRTCCAGLETQARSPRATWS